MAENRSTNSRSRIFAHVAVFILFGFLTGFTWFAALLPVGVTGVLGYDVSRYCFALSAVLAIVGLFYRPWRNYGLGLFLVGLVLGIACWPTLVPMAVRPNPRLTHAMILFGGPLGLAAVSGMVFFLACLGNNRKGSENGPATTPRRFGMGTLILVLGVASLFFGVARWVGMPPALSVSMGTFLALISGLQMLMNRVPRAVSVGTGTALLPTALAIVWITSGRNAGPPWAAFVGTPADIAFVGAHSIVLGAVCGYIGGALVAGLFLISDRTSRMFGNPSHTDPASPAGIGVGTNHET